MVKGTLVSMKKRLRLDVRKYPIKNVKIFEFPRECLKENANMSKFPKTRKYASKNVNMLRCLNVVKFLKKSATKVLTNLE